MEIRNAQNEINLDQTDITGANFEGAEYDDRTLFPAFFDPNKHGMVFRPKG
ncbi:MAG TPA: hypothetical protein VF074_15885 [Pyrinomonadaceae bacterium]